MQYVTMQITFLTRKFRNGERNLHCDVVHITTKWFSSLTLDCNGVFAIKAYTGLVETLGLTPKKSIPVKTYCYYNIVMDGLCGPNTCD